MDRFTEWSQRLNCLCKDVLLVMLSWLARFLKVLAACQKNMNGPVFHSRQREREQQQIDLTKTIIALDFEGLLVEHSRFFRKDMNRLNVLPTMKSLWQKLQFWREVGYFYKRRPHYDQFVKLLSRIPETVLFVYSKEQKQVADRLIEELRLSHYFPMERRRYHEDCRQLRGLSVKHPAYVDMATARVIILTTDFAGECDGSDESSKYFLQVPNNGSSEQLMRYGELLTEVIVANRKKEDLHEDLQNKVARWQHRNKL